MMPGIRELISMEEETIFELDKALDEVTGEPPTHRHFFTKEELEYNKAFGTTMKALCGYVKEGTARQLPHLPVCPKCKEIYESLEF